MRQTDERVNNLPEQTIDALIEITHSKQLEQFKKEYRTPEGGVMTMFKLDEKEAEKAVKEHWDEPAENSSGEK